MSRLYLWIVLCFAASAASALSQETGLIGSHSCAASTCHGNKAGLGESWNHSLTQFLAHDPHASAGLVLTNPQSRSIVRILDPTATFPSQQYDAVLRARCISCHTTATSAECESAEPIPKVFLAKGVSCESCHGPAADWVDIHVLKSFDAQRHQTSIRDTASIVGRADTCVRCHIGSRTDDGLVRDMNHDLIAAGHPALRFDLLIFSDMLPAHWDVTSSEHQEFVESRLKTRTVSRWINLAAAGKLSAERAIDHQSDSSVPWPEFSDYDCFGCHQSLQTFSPQTSLLKISDGLPIWNSWHSVGQIELHGKRERLQKLSPHRSDPSTVAKIGLGIAKIHREKAEGGFEHSDPRSVFDSMVDQIKKQTPYDWHESAIAYLNLEAAVSDIESSEQLGASNPLRIGIDNIGKRLRFGTSPSKNRLYRSPAKFDPKAFQSAVVRQFSPTESTQ